MAKTVVGLFDTFAEAQNVVQELINNGFQRNDISIVANERARGEYSREVGEKGSSGAEGAGAGAVGGTVVGGVVGLLVGAGLLAIPGIGPVLAAGPLAAAIGTPAAAIGATALGAGIGAAAGGLVGGLIGAGVPEDEANYYAEGVRRGGTLVTVSTSDAMATSAYNIMQRFHAVDIKQRGTSWRESGWDRFDPESQPYDFEDERRRVDRDRNDWEDSSKVGTAAGTATGAATGAAIGAAGGPVGTVIGGAAGATVGAGVGAAGDVAGEKAEDKAGYGSGKPMRSYNDYDPEFRSHFQSNFGSVGGRYNDYAPAYRYGYDMANDASYTSSDWATVESELHRRWERQHPDSAWERFKDSVRYAWDKARGRS